jgi:hypothetical protein
MEMDDGCTAWKTKLKVKFLIETNHPRYALSGFDLTTHKLQSLQVETIPLPMYVDLCTYVDRAKLAPSRMSDQGKYVGADSLR